MPKPTKKPKTQKPTLFEIPLDSTDEELDALAKAMRVAYFGYDPQESPDFIPLKRKERKNDRGISMGEVDE